MTPGRLVLLVEQVWNVARAEWTFLTQDSNTLESAFLRLFDDAKLDTDDDELLADCFRCVSPATLIRVESVQIDHIDGQLWLCGIVSASYISQLDALNRTVQNGVKSRFPSWTVSPHAFGRATGNYKLQICPVTEECAERIVTLDWIPLMATVTAGALVQADGTVRRLPLGPKTVHKSARTCGSMPDLVGAVRGQVVTRFPPEPSGYLHIGHVKAVMLNNYYARAYDGKMLLRFDDTNPSKEKEEFSQAILDDLKRLNIVPDMVSHTSDHFDLCIAMAQKLILDGNGYMDDTPVETMRCERMTGVDSSRRNATVHENLERFDAMLSGSEDGQKWCLRAKIDMSLANKALRDPVMFRSNLDPHPRTGTRYKAYPTYDFSCPIVDSVEGVTHALRTTEYRDRLDQYQWVIKSLGLRPVHVWEFSRLNFIRTTMSKRKLQWFVQHKYVDGWDDPRLPTVQGIIRRGMTVEALRTFILSQGASRRVVAMEWDKLWSENRKVIDPVAPRFTVVDKHTCVPVKLTGVCDLEFRSVPLHPKRSDLGNKVVALSSSVLLCSSDADALTVGQEIVLMKWDTFVVTEVNRTDMGVVCSITLAYRPGGDFKGSTKVTWLADQGPDLTPVNLYEYDDLLTKDQLDENDKLDDFVNQVSEKVTEAVGDPSLRNVQMGDIVQLERRGFFRVDRVYLSDDKPLKLIMIPDGKMR